MPKAFASCGVSRCARWSAAAGPTRSTAAESPAGSRHSDSPCWRYSPARTRGSVPSSEPVVFALPLFSVSRPVATAAIVGASVPGGACARRSEEQSRPPEGATRRKMWAETAKSDVSNREKRTSQIRWRQIFSRYDIFMIPHRKQSEKKRRSEGNDHFRADIFCVISRPFRNVPSSRAVVMSLLTISCLVSIWGNMGKYGEIWGNFC